MQGAAFSEQAINPKRPTNSLKQGVMGTQDQDIDAQVMGDSDRSKQNPFENDNEYEEHDRQAFMSIQQQTVGRNGGNDFAADEFYSGRFNNLSNTQSNKKKSSNLISGANSNVDSP